MFLLIFNVLMANVLEYPRRINLLPVLQCKMRLETKKDLSLSSNFFDLNEIMTTKFPVSDELKEAVRVLRAGGVIGLAPATAHGCLRYDSNPAPHDHFVCSSCDGLHDITIAPALRRELARQVAGCLVDGPLIITGTCHPCYHDNHNS